MTGRIEKLKHKFDLTVHWRTFPLHPETPEEGAFLTDLFNTTEERIQVMVEGLQKTARSLGLPFNARPKTYNSRLAQELGLWAEDQGRGDQFHMAAFHAYFADCVNLAQIPELLGIVKNAGLNTIEAKQVLSNRSYKKNVDLDWADSRFKGITAIPTFIMGQHKLTGAQSYEVLEELVNVYHVPLRKEE